MPVSRGKALYGRDAETGAITAMLDAARADRGGGAVIRGEATPG